MKYKVLISGASFAGLTLAYWLEKNGCEVSIVEMASSLRLGGSPIDVRGATLALVKEMGLYDEILAKKFFHRDKFVDANNNVLVEFNINDQPEYNGDIEIKRDDLLQIVYNALPKDRIDIRFGQRILDLKQDDAGVNIQFKNGKEERFDLLIGADGTHSATRKIVFGEEAQFNKFLGVYFAFSDYPDIKNDGEDAIWIYQELGKRAIEYVMDHHTLVGLFFQSPKVDYDYHDVAAQRAIVAAHFKDCDSWHIPQIKAAIMNKKQYFFFDEACQIKMPTWSKGRVALVGDAAYTASFFTGMGTSLAMLGAKALADALLQNDDCQMAFGQYYTSYHPFVTQVQESVYQRIAWWFPKDEAGIKASLDRLKVE